MEPRKLTKEKVSKAVKESQNLREAYSKVSNSRNSSSGYQWFRKMVEKYEIDTSHFVAHANKNAIQSKKLKWEEVLVYNRKGKFYREDIRILRRALLESGTPWQCDDCGNKGEWNNQRMILEVDHIDKDPINNQKNNLRFLCPNCHSLYSNSQKWREITKDSSGKYTKRRSKEHELKGKCDKCGEKATTNRCLNCYFKDREKGKWPSDEELSLLLWEKPSEYLAQEIGVSGSALSKRCKLRKIKKPPRGYWS